MRFRARPIYVISVAVLVGVLIPPLAHAVTLLVAQDDASNYTNSTWSGDEGLGLDTWVFRISGGGGFYLDESGGQVDGIATSGNTWGMWANDGGGAGVQHVAAFRGFGWNGSYWQNALTRFGDEFRISFEHGAIDPNSSCGFTLRNGNSDADASNYNTGSRFEFGWFRGAGAADSTYTIYDGSGGGVDTGVAPRFTGLDIVLRLTGADSYEVSIYDATNAVVALTNITSTLGASGSIDSVALYDRDTDGDPGNDVYFNKIEIRHFLPPTMLIVK